MACGTAMHCLPQRYSPAAGYAQIVVLTWGSSQRDLEAVERILSQVLPSLNPGLMMRGSVIQQGPNRWMIR